MPLWLLSALFTKQSDLHPTGQGTFPLYLVLYDEASFECVIKTKDVTGDAMIIPYNRIVELSCQKQFKHGVVLFCHFSIQHHGDST